MSAWLMLKTYRWHPVVPMGFSTYERTRQDVCEGHKFPKGAMLMPNTG